jgi:hypothetical protein
MQKAVIDEAFLTLINALKAESASFAGFVRQTATETPFTTEVLQDQLDLQDQTTFESRVSDAFKLAQAVDATIAAYKQEDPGNLADSILLTSQLDYAAQMERAYRARHMQGFPRMIAHVANRKAGQASESGLFSGQILGYMTSLLKQGGGSETNDS